MPRTVALILNPDKPADALREVREIVARHGTLLGEGLASKDPALREPERGPLAKADVVVVVGGDGTLLSQARRFARPGTALLGVNMGRLGFLANFDVEALRQHAHTLLGGEAPLDVREYNLLRVRVYAKPDAPGAEHEATPRFDSLALNDAVITAGPPYRLITLALSIDGREGPTVRGDGLIVSSPLGSTAYNLSAGGPILAPETDGFAITPIAAQSLSFRPVVVPGASIIRVAALRINQSDGTPGSPGTTLVLDGQIHTPLLTGDRIEICKHTHGVRFVMNPGSDWWSRLMGKFGWAASPALR
jgi:NAD+ kinase